MKNLSFFCQQGINSNDYHLSEPLPTEVHPFKAIFALNHNFVYFDCVPGDQLCCAGPHTKSRVHISGQISRVWYWILLSTQTKPHNAFPYSSLLSVMGSALFYDLLCNITILKSYIITVLICESNTTVCLCITLCITPCHSLRSPCGHPAKSHPAERHPAEGHPVESDIQPSRTSS